MERKPDTVVFTYETTIDYVVDLRTKRVKVGDVGEIADEPHYIALFCEGEFAGEEFLVQGEREDEDRAVIEQAEDILEGAFETSTIELPSIHDLFDAVRNHPDFAGGTVWTRTDVADALAGAEEFETFGATPEQVAAVTVEQLRESIKTLENYIFEGIYSWDEAIRDNVTTA